MTEKQYYSQITRYGTQVINECLSSIDKKLIASDWYIAIGTGDLIPTEDTEELINPIYDKNSANYVGISFGTDPNYGRFAKIIVPEEIQGSIIKELGLFDGNNKLICAAKTYADLSQKLADGLAYDYSLTLYLQAIPSNVEIVYINPNAMATIEEVENKIDEKIGDIDFSSFEVKANKGQSNGYCPLDEDNLVPLAHLPEIPPATTLKQYHDVVFVSGTNVLFGGDYTSFNGIDISSYADDTYRVFAKTSSAIIPKTYTEGATEPTNPAVGDVWKYIPTAPAEGEEQTETECYKEYVTITTPATEDTEETTTNEWQEVELTELAKIVIASGNVTEVQDSLQYTTEEALTEVEIHTVESFKDIVETADDTLTLIPYTFSELNLTDYTTISANTNYTLKRDCRINTASISTFTITDNEITSTYYGTEVNIKAGVTVKSSVAGKGYYYY